MAHFTSYPDGSLRTRADSLLGVEGRHVTSVIAVGHGKAYADWLKDQGTGFASEIRTAALDPFHSYANTIRNELPEACPGLGWVACGKAWKRHR